MHGDHCQQTLKTIIELKVEQKCIAIFVAFHAECLTAMQLLKAQSISWENAYLQTVEEPNEFIQQLLIWDQHGSKPLLQTETLDAALPLFGPQCNSFNNS